MRGAGVTRRARACAPLARRAVLALLAALALGGAVARAQDTSRYLGKVVGRVEIALENVPAGTADDGTIRDVVERFVRAGDPLSAEQARRAIDRLTESGAASRVSVEVVEAGAGVAVRFRVTRPVRIAAVQIRGEDAAAAEALRGRLTALATGTRLTQNALDRGTEEIARYYEERGHFEARVRSEVQLDSTATRATAIYTIEPGAQAKVGAFELTGDAGIPREKLVAGVRLAPGTPYTRAGLDAAVEAVRRAYLAAGYLAPEVGEPEVTRNPAANTVAVRLRVASGPRVEVAVEGADIAEADLRATLPVFTEGGLDEFQLAEGARRLTERLQRDGYFFARVAYRLEPPAAAVAATRRVIYAVDPGRQYRVTEVDVIGTTAVTYAALAPSLRSKEAGFRSRGLTSRELLQRDSETVERKLRSIGYRRAVVRERRLGVLPDSPDLVITFVVEEGPRSRVASVGLEGNAVFSRDELLGSGAVKPGDFYGDEAIAADANAILAKYADSGFVSAEVQTRIVELEGDAVRVVFDVGEGRKAFVGSVRIDGARRTTQRSLENYFQFAPGDVLRLEALRRSEQALFETGAFRQVIIHSEPAETSPDGTTERRTVFVDVEEASPWSVVYGGGFNSDEGPRGLFELSNANLFGRLNTAALRVRASRREQLAQLSYTNPLPFGFDVPLLVSFNVQRQIKQAFGIYRFTALTQFQKRLDLKSSLFFRYNFEQVRIFDPSVSERELERSDRPVRLGRLSATYVRDTRDNPFDPISGDFVSADGSLATEAFGGNEAYMRLFAEYQRYYGVPKLANVVYAGAVKFGVADPLGDRRRLPITERFFAGGARSLRGFGFEEAGPRDKVTNEPIGGNALLVVNNELRFPLFWRFGGAVFSDTGNVFRRLRDVDVGKLTESVGFGLSFQTPVGPIRVDFGYLLNPPATVTRRGAVHFSFGQAF